MRIHVTCRNLSHCQRQPKASFGIWKWHEQKNDIQGTIDEPYFNGKDVLIKRVNESYKTQLQLVCETHANPISYHDGKAILYRK